MQSSLIPAAMAESNVHASLPEETVSDVTSGLPQVPSVLTSTWLSHAAMVSLPKMPPDGLFTGFNLLQWCQYVQITLKGRLMRHLEEDRPPHSDLAYYNWLDIEGVVHRWLLDSITPSVKGEFLSLESARAIWEAVLDSHSKKNNIATLYELVHRAANLRQGDRSVMDYNNELTALWAEIDHYMLPDPDSVDRKYILQLRVFQFLMGLTPEYEQLRGQHVHREMLIFKDALWSVCLEEARLHQAQSQIPATAMAIQSSTTTRRPTSTGNLSRGTSPRTEETPRGDPYLFCNNCKKRGHSKETCFKLQRKRAQQAHVATHVATMLSPGSTSGVPLPNQVPMPNGLLPPPGTALPSFTPEEIERLQRLLDPSVVGSCSLAHAGTSTALATSSSNPSRIFPHPFRTSPSTSSSWIVDSGATSHMTPNPPAFMSYEPSPRTSKVCTALGDLLTIAGVGRVALTPSLHLSRVLHVPRLAVHLLSLSKFVRDLNRDLTFNPNLCFYREKVSGKKITLVEEHQGLYFIRPPATERAHVVVVSSSPSYDCLWLHRRLGHPSFSTLCLLFPRLFWGQPVDRFICDACSRAKHHRTTYPLSLSLVQLPLSLSFIQIFGDLQS